MRSLIICIPKYSSGDKIEKNEMGVAYSTYWGEERCIQDFGGENLRERNHWGNLGVYGRIILRWIFGKRDIRTWNGSGWFSIGTGSCHV
jgi:hypothetical protein